MDEARDVALLVLIAFSIALNLYLIWRMNKYENTPLELDEKSAERLEEVTAAADKARRDLSHQVGLARVEMRNIQQATSNARSAQRGDRKW